MKVLFHSLSLSFFAFLAVLGILMVLVFFDLAGIHTQPILINGIRYNLPDLNTIKDFVARSTIIERKNPLQESVVPKRFPSSTVAPELSEVSPPYEDLRQVQVLENQVIPTLEVTPTPVPPLDPVVYRTEVTLRAKNFATALEAFLTANDLFGEDKKVLEDPVWRSEMSATLDQVSEAAQSLSAVGPPPPEYKSIHSWLQRVGPESENLRENYNQSLETGDPSGFTAAGKNFNQIKEDLAAALSEMAKAGWPLN